MPFTEVGSTKEKGDLLRFDLIGENEQFNLDYVEFIVCETAK